MNKEQIKETLRSHVQLSDIEYFRLKNAIADLDDDDDLKISAYEALGQMEAEGLTPDIAY